MWRIGVAFVVGQCVVHSLASLPAVWPYGVLLAVAFALAATFRFVLAASVLLGIAWAWSHAHVRLGDDLPSALEGQDLVISGRIASILDTRALDQEFEFHVEHASDARVPRRVRLAWYDSPDRDRAARPRTGEIWRLVVRLKRRNGFANPGGFDYEGHLFRSGIGGTGYVRDDARNAKLDERKGYVVLKARAWLAERIALAVDGSSMLGILQGLAVGDTQEMLPDQWRVFAATGTSHLMAISGLHISMVAALAAWLGGRLARVPAAQRWRLTAIHGQAIAGMSAALGYALLAGMSVPTQRTLVMLCIYFVARWRRRAIGVGNALGLALVGVVLVDPFAPLSVGAWLSFGAVAVIVLATAGRLQPERPLRNFARVQWAVTIGLLPIVVIAFGGASLISPLANAVAVPLFTLLLVPLVLIGTAVACVSLDAGGVLLQGSAKLLESCWPLIEWFAQQPLAMWYVPQMPWWHHAMLAIGALLLVLPGAWPLRCAAVALCLPTVLFRPAAPARGAFELAMLDVGQGLAIVVRTQAHTLVFDAGPAFRTGRDTGELVLLPYLRHRGVRAVDRLVVSHGDLDHEGGARSLLLGMPTRSVLVGPSVEGLSYAARCAHGQRWAWDAVEFEILHPTTADFEAASDNDSSCVLAVTGEGGTALITGDIEADAELAILNRSAVRADIVVVAHHGSASSSTAAFVEAARARFAFVSAGYRNRWNFPRPDVVARWRASGAEVVSTIEGGAIEATVRPHAPISLRRHRREHERYWSAR